MARYKCYLTNATSDNLGGGYRFRVIDTFNHDVEVYKSAMWSGVRCLTEYHTALDIYTSMKEKFRDIEYNFEEAPELNEQFFNTCDKQDTYIAVIEDSFLFNKRCIRVRVHKGMPSKPLFNAYVYKKLLTGYGDIKEWLTMWFKRFQPLKIDASKCEYLKDEYQ